MRLTVLGESGESRRAVLLVYALIFYTAALELAIVPLLPPLSEEFDLSTVEAGALLASMNVTVMLASIPLGQLSDRIGAHRMTVAAAALYALAAVGQGFSPTYGLLLLSWATFGLGVAIVVSGSLAWLSDVMPPEERATALGGAATVSGIGVIAGPLFGGVLVESIGRGTSFLLAAIFAGLLAVAVYTSTSEPTRQSRRLPLTATLLAVRGEPLVLGGLALVGLLGLVFGIVGVLVPLGLAANGLSSGEVGLVFSATAGVFVAVSWIVARSGTRPVSLRLAAILAFAQAAILLIPIASLSTIALVAFLFCRAPIWGTSSTISYPLTADGAHRAGLGRGAIFGLLNLVWGIAAVAGPLLGGAIAQVVGERWAYGSLALFCAGSGAVLLSLAKQETSLRPTSPLTSEFAQEVAE